jgi:hypothetical protein
MGSTKFRSLAKQLMRASKFFLLVASIGFVFLGEGRAQVLATPLKPKNVPAQSVWVGGADGGIFVLLKKVNRLGKGIYIAQIHAQSGYLEYKGKLKIEPVNSLDFDTSDKESCSFWGGDSLHLRDGRILKKIK